MNARHTLLACSLAVNAACAWLIVRAHLTTQPGLPPAPVASAAQSRTAAVRDAAAPLTASANPLPLDQQRDRLLALGVPRAVVIRAIRAMIEEKRLARQREFFAAAAKQPWWRGGLVYQDITPEQQRELRELRKAEREEIVRVLGPQALVEDAELQRYAFLPDEKAAQLAALERDYSELRRESAPDGSDPQERQRLLTAEYERDLAALLSPEERAALHERESNTARTLGYRFEFFNATDAEYRAVFAAQKAFDDKFGRTAGAPLAGDLARARSDGMRQLEQDIKSALGPQRFEEYLLSQRSEYRALTALHRRYELPQPAIDQVARVQLETAEAAHRIADDTSTSREQKKTALTQLAARARTGVRSALAPNIADTYLAATSSSWIDLLERGSVYRSMFTGGHSTRNVAGEQPKPPAQPTPPKP